MKDLFFLSGLGADKRVFEYLDLRAYKVHFMEWIDPLDDESITDYAIRLSGKITIPNPILIGVSFGGLVAIEIGKQMATEKIIIISSARTKENLPTTALYRRLMLHRFLPTRFIKKPNKILFWLFGVKNKKERDLLRDIMADTDERFFRWAIHQIMIWENEMLLDNTVHIHGLKDRLIPFTTADYPIADGGHLMIMTHAAEIDVILTNVLQ